MSVYLIRHGQTDWNKEGIVQGRCDIPLNERGREQARAAKELTKDIPFDICFCSPLDRAKETASIVLEGRDVQIVCDDRLLEMAYGIYEGTDWRKGEYQNRRRQFAIRNKNGESYLDVCYRAFSFLEEIKPLGIKGNVLLVCHGGVARVIHSYFEDDADNDKFVDNICPNGGVRKYEYVERHVERIIADYKTRFKPPFSKK